MNYLRKLTFAVLTVLGLLLAAPAAAKTFHGDVYLGFDFGALTGLMQGASMPGLSADMTGQMKLPFRAKVYYQDGVLRLEAELPSGGNGGGAADQAKAAYQIFSLLIDYQTYDLVLLNHGNRHAYRLTVPPELHELIRPQDPMAVLRSKEFIEAFNQEGIKYLGTKRVKSRLFAGLNTDGIEMSFRVVIPEADLAEMREAGVDFDTKFTLRLYLEEETHFPLLYKIDSSLFSLAFQLVNLRRDRLPDVLFEIPAFYTIEEYSVYELESLFADMAKDLGLENAFTVPPEAIEELAPERAPPGATPEAGE
jgi:hypothetical protein